MSEPIDIMTLGLLHNVAKHQPIEISPVMPGAYSLHDALAEQGLIEWVDGCAVVSEAGWKVIEQNPFPGRRLRQV